VGPEQTTGSAGSGQTLRRRSGLVEPEPEPVPVPDPGSGSRATGGHEHGLGLGLDCA